MNYEVPMTNLSFRVLEIDSSFAMDTGIGIRQIHTKPF